MTKQTEPLTNEQKVVAGLILFGLFYWAAVADSSPTTPTDYTASNLSSVCVDIATAKVRGFSSWDYNTKEMTHTNGNATVFYSHEINPGNFLKCLYDKENSKVEWNTRSTKGRYTVPKDFHSSSMTLNLQ